jgi:hypothetical protein
MTFSSICLLRLLGIIFFVKDLSDLRYDACRQCCGLLEDKAVIEWLTESGVG